VWSPESEDQAVRQYRFLLRTAPLDALEEGHVELLGLLSQTRRALVLRAVQEGLVAGLRLTPHAVRPMAHLLVRGERRRPGDFLRACEPSVLVEVAEGVIVSEAMFGRFGGYAAWDGADPVIDPGVDDSAYSEQWHIAHQTHVLYRTPTGAPISPHTFGPPGV